MVDSPGFIKTLTTGISDTTELIDGTDKLHSGILDALFAISSGCFITSEHGGFTEDTTGANTSYTLAGEIQYVINGQPAIQTADQTVTMPASFATYNRYVLIYLDSSGVIQTASPASESAQPKVSKLPANSAPIALVEITPGNDGVAHNVQMYLSLEEYKDSSLIRVKNDSGSDIAKGKALYISGTHNGNLPEVGLADASSASTMPCIGVSFAAITNGEEGFAVVLGRATGIAANFTAGDTLYVSTTAGALTDTKPTGATDLIQNVGILMAPDASNAKVFVTGIGRSNDVPNLAFVTADSSGLANGRQLNGGTGITVTDNGAGSTIDIINSAPDQTVSLTGAGITVVTGSYPNFTITSTEADTLDSVTGRGNQTLNNISVGDFTGGGTMVNSSLEANITNFGVGFTLGHRYYYANEPTGGLLLVAGSDGQIITIKNMNTAPLILTGNPSPAVLIEGGVPVSADPRYTGPSQITLPQYESITLHYVLDTGGISPGWYIHNSDLRGSGGLADVVDDTTPQLGGDLDTNSNNITGDFALTGAVQMKKSVVATGNVSPAASAADSGKYFYRASGETANFTLPADTYIGEQYVLMNNSGSAITIASTGGDTIVGSTSVPHESAVTIIAVAANTWFVVG